MERGYSEWCWLLKKWIEGFVKKQSKVEKVLYSRAFFNISSGVENILKTYFVFGTLTKGFQKGPKSHFLVKNRQN